MNKKEELENALKIVGEAITKMIGNIEFDDPMEKPKRVMTIGYDKDEVDLYLEYCKHQDYVLKGSVSCQECKPHFQSIDIEQQTVQCSHPDNKPFKKGEIVMVNWSGSNWDMDIIKEVENYDCIDSIYTRSNIVYEPEYVRRPTKSEWDKIVKGEL